jgi:hypothetical protein
VYSTSVYFFIPRQTVVLNVGSSPRRYQTVYAKNLKLHKGVDNRLQFQFLNQEQKPVDVTGKEITIRIISDDGAATIVKSALTPVFSVNGIMELQLTSSELDSIDSQKASYSIEIPAGQFNLPVFVAGDGGARGVVDIVDSILPKHLPSMQVGISTHEQPNNNTVVFYSDVVSTSYTPSITVQAYYTGFSGVVKVQGSTSPTTDWYDIADATYIESTQTDMYVIEGFHPYLRLQFTSTQGTVDKILAR